MFMVRVDRCTDLRYRPLTVEPHEYLYVFAELIARSVPDAEVHAHLGQQAGDEVVFRGKDLDSEEVELF